MPRIVPARRGTRTGGKAPLSETSSSARALMRTSRFTTYPLAGLRARTTRPDSGASPDSGDLRPALRKTDYGP